MKNLPIGIQTFEKLISQDSLYNDKTQLIYELISSGSAYFLSRPRRFGKSLLISTLEAIFKGKKALFKGLWLEHSNWQWQEYPVIRIDFSELTANTPQQLESKLKSRLCEIYKDYQLTPPAEGDLQQFFIALITKLSKLGQVVILIDEYDKNIIDNIMHPQAAAEIRELLKSFYSIIKSRDEHIKFVLLTGITKFSKMSVFSGLNNLNDISMDAAWTTLLGCTEQEIDNYFPDYIQALADKQQWTVAKTREEMREWYNGFRFSKAEITVYNPYSLLLLFTKYEFDNYWFSTATPTFLLNLIKTQKYDVQQIESKNIRREAFASYDIEQLEVLPLLLQTGYITIQSYNRQRDNYNLSYPNKEVAESFNRYLIRMFTSVPPEQVDKYLWECIDALEANDLETFFSNLEIFFANLAYELHLPYEKYYQSIFYLLFKILGVNIHAEMKTNKGSIDTVMETATHIYIMEFKFDGSAQQALQQIHDKQYYQKYQRQQKHLVLVGVNFSRSQRNLDDYVVEAL